MSQKGAVAKRFVVAALAAAPVLLLITQWKKVVEAYGGFHEALVSALGISAEYWWVTHTVVIGAIVAIALSAWLPRWLHRRRQKRLRDRRNDAELLMEKADRERVFRLDPQPRPKSPKDRITFDRADGVHKEISHWIRRSNRPLLYVTGQSGTGKSSLMAAYVAPALNRGVDVPANADAETMIAVIVRAFGDLDATLCESIGAADVVWKDPPDLSQLSAREILERAARRLNDQKAHLVLIFDQFEEVLVGETPEHQAAVPAVVLAKSLCDKPIPEITGVLVARAEYGDAFRSLGLPERIEFVTWQNVPAFLVGQAAAVLRDGLERLHGERADNATTAMSLARQAEALGKVPQYVTPVALNMSGVMYESDKVLGKRLAEAGVNAAEGVLPSYVRARIESGDLFEVGPKVLNQLVTPTGDREQPRDLSNLSKSTGVPNGAIENALFTLARHGLVRRVGAGWEVSHDFLAPLIRRVLDRIAGSLWRRLWPLLPVPVVAVMLLMSVGMWGVSQARRADDSNAFNLCARFQESTRAVTVDGPITPAAARHMSRIRGEWSLAFAEGTNDVNHWLRVLADPDTGLKALTKLHLWRTDMTDAGLKELARTETGLKALKELEVYPDVWTDELLRYVARADTGLKGLTTLDLEDTPVTDAGLKELARGDTGLKALTTLNLRGTQVTDAGLKDLARAEIGLKALTTLSLWDTKVTDAGLKELARADTGLKALTELDLWVTQVTDAGIAEVRRRFPNIKIRR